MSTEKLQAVVQKRS